jgi:hypothetical protein
MLAMHRVRAPAAVFSKMQIERDADAFGTEARDPRADRVRFAYGDAADDDAARARVEQALHVAAAHAAAGLQIRHAARELFDEGELLRRACTCAVEVDDMQPLRAGLRVRACERERIGVERACLREIALTQAHDAAVAKVDGRDDDHASAKKLASARWPAAADFSGWNCMPNTLSRATAAAKGPPWSLVAIAASFAGAA